MQKVGVVGDAIGGQDVLSSLVRLFPGVEFKCLKPAWPESLGGDFDILIVGVSATNAGEVDEACRRLQATSPQCQVVIALRDADVNTTRLLSRAGAADILPTPVTDAALALSLERLLVREASQPKPGEQRGEVVAFLKAGGGVGATTLAVQAAAILAARRKGEVCVADLDLQFGAAALYLDLNEAVTVTDVLASGGGLADTPFVHALGTHRSGARILAAPHDLTPLDSLTAPLADALIGGLRRNFALTLVDLPSVWTAWTNQVLQSADRIVLVTQLSVPHVHLAKRQLDVMRIQRLADHPTLLVCNAVSADQQAALTLKAAERALGRSFDIVVPEDRRTVLAATNQGVEISAVRTGTKVEQAVSLLADRVAGTIGAVEPSRRFGLWRR
ncbi:MAG TPA: AAA family ATPase [Caulobacteraceae bacterium]|jgi:pilus assembly protein CpaE